MILCILDFETSSLDIKNCSITEMAWAFFNTDTNKIVACNDFLIQPHGEELTQEASEITHITKEDLLSGIGHSEAMHYLFRQLQYNYKINFFTGHNCNIFDKPIFERYVSGFPLRDQDIFNFPWLDTRCDIPYPAKLATRKLTYLCLEHGYNIQGAHRAINDVMGCSHLIAHYGIEKILAYKNSPSLRVELLNVRPPWEDQHSDCDKAKALGFGFIKEYGWHRILKKFELEELRPKIEFQYKVVIL